MHNDYDEEASFRQLIIHDENYEMHGEVEKEENKIKKDSNPTRFH